MERTITLAVPPIPFGGIVTGMGMPEGAEPGPAIRKVIDEMLAIAPGLMEPRAFVASLTLDRGGETLRVSGEPCTWLGSARLDGAEGLVAVVTTIGPELEARMAELLSEGDALSALALDAIGSTAVMEAVACAHAIVAGMLAHEGYASGEGIEPGLGGADLELQDLIFRATRPELIGVTMGDSSLMSPRKSLSSLLPYGEALARPAPRCACCRGGGAAGCQGRCPDQPAGSA